MYWVKKGGLSTPYIDLPILALNPAQWLKGATDPNGTVTKIRDIMKARYEQNLHDIVFSTAPINFPDVWMEIEPTTGQGKALKVIRLDETAPSPSICTGRFSGAISHFAQKLPPVNQILDLVFFAAGEVTPPNGTIGFIAFPVGGTDWDAGTNAPVKSHLSEDHYSLTYKPRGKNVFKLYCPVASLPEIAAVPPNGSPIQLRENGNFLGRVRLDAADVEDWLPGIFKRMGQFFSLTDHFARYLFGNGADPLIAPVATLPVGDPNTDHKARVYVDFLLRLEEFLLTTSRDALGFGLQPTEDGSSWVDFLARGYADSTGIPETAPALAAAVKNFLQPQDAAFSLDHWKQILDVKNTWLGLSLEEIEPFPTPSSGSPPAPENSARPCAPPSPECAAVARHLDDLSGNDQISRWLLRHCLSAMERPE